MGFSTGVCCHALLQGIFPTQGLNPGLSHYMQILCHLSLCWFLLHRKVNQSHVYLYTLFLDFPSHLGDRRAVSTVPVLHSKFSVVIHFIHSTSSVCSSAPVSQLILPSPLPACCPWICSLCLCLYFCFANKIVIPFPQIPHICVNIQYLFFSFWLTSFCMTIFSLQIISFLCMLSSPSSSRLVF